MADWEEVLEGTEIAMNASGSASERMSIVAESLQGKLNSLRDSWDEFVLGLGSSETIKSIIDILTGLLNTLDFLLNDIPLVSNAIKTILVAQGINILLGALKQLKNIFNKNGFSFGGLINFSDLISKFKETSTAIKGVEGASAAASVTTKNFSEALGKAAASAVAFVAANPVLAIVALVAAVGAGIAAFVAYNNSLEKAKEKYEELSQATSEAQSEVDNVKTQLESIDTQIEEINSKDRLTLTDKDELSNLESQRKELELILATKEKLAEVNAREEAEEAKKIVDKKYKNDNVSATRYNTSYADMDDVENGLYGAFYSEYLSDVVYAYDYLDSKKKQGIALTEEEQEAYKKLEASMTKELAEAQNYLDSIKASGDTTSEAYQKVYSIVDGLESRLTPEEWKAVKLSDLIDTSNTAQEVQQTIASLKEQLSSGLIDENTYNQKIKEAIYNLANDPEIQQGIKNIFGNDATVYDIANTLAEGLGVSLNNAVDNIDISSFDNLKSKIENEISYLDIDFDIDTSSLENITEGLGDTSDLSDLGNALDEIGQGIENYKSEIESLSSTYDSLGSNVDNAVSMLDAINSNMDALTGQTQLSGEETQKLIDEFSALGTVIDVSTGQAYNGMDLLNQTVLNTGASASDMQTSVQSFMGGVTNAGNNTINAMNYVLEAIIKVKQALAGALNTAASFVDKASSTINKIGNSLGGKLVSKFFGIDASDITSATQGLSSVANSLRNEATSISNSIQTEQAALIQQTQQYQAKLQNAGKAGKKAYNDSIAKGAGSAKKATDDLTDALKEQYEAEKAILEQQKEQLQTQKELLNAEKERLNEAKDAINNLIDMTMDMLKQQYEDEIDALDKQKDALEDQLDAFEEKINKQKEILELQRKEEEHQDELAEKNKTIADIQAELAEIQFDNSAEGQKRRLELLEQLNQAQQDLNDYQSDHDYDVKNDALDKELEAYKQMIDAKKELIDQQEEYVRQQMENDYNLYMQAIQLIQGRSGEFYNQLIEWNRVYGTHLDTDVKLAWERCYKALDEYGYLGVGVQGVLEGITARTAEIEEQNKIIENSIKSIENELDVLKQKYDAATQAAKEQAAASREAAAAANAAAAASRQASDAAKQAAENMFNAKLEAMGRGDFTTDNSKNYNSNGLLPGLGGTMPKFHTGTDYVKKANSWLDDMLGLGPNETASILKVGEAVIPDYANPNANSFGTQSFSIDKPATVGAPISNQDNSVTIKIGDIIIQGDADENTVAKLNRTKESIIQEMFKRINKHSMMNGYKNVRYSN